MRALTLNEPVNVSNPLLVLLVEHLGFLVDPVELSFQVYADATAVTGRVSVDLNAHRLSVGRFVATFTPTLEGKHQIRWFFRAVIGAVERSFRADFEVLTQSADPAREVYGAVADMRAGGLAVEAVNDARAQEALVHATQLIERVTGLWFGPRVMTLTEDGPGAPVLFLQIPIVAIAAARLLEEEVPLSELVVANRHVRGQTHPDDRGAPTVTRRCGAWVRDIHNVEVDGVFGYTEPDLTIPAPVQRAAAILAETYATTQDPESLLESLMAQGVRSETTRDQSITFGSRRDTGVGALVPRFGTTGNVVADTLLARYRPPIAMRSV